MPEPTFPVRIGRCIYCGASSGLTDEHVIPFSLGGVWELLDASCKDCQTITSRIERHIAHEHFLAVRTVAGFPTYRPKKRPKTLEQGVRIGEAETKELQMTPAEHPAPLVFLQFDSPTFITGAETPSIPKVLSAKVVARGAQLHALAAKTDASKYTVPLPDRTLYARFFAKVAFAFAVGSLGLEAFADVFVRGAILGRSADSARWVGSVETEQWTSTDGDHECVCVQAGDIVQVGVRLLKQWGGPEYRIVVGRLHPISPVQDSRAA